MFWCNSSLDCLSLAPFLRFGLSNRTWNERVPVWEQETLSTVLDVLIRAKRSKSSQELTHEWRQFRTLKLTVTPCVHFLMGSFSRGWDVAVYVWHKPTELAHSFFYSVLVSISVYMAFSVVFHSITSPDNSPFSHSVLPVLSLPYWSFQLHTSLRVSFSPDIIHSGWRGTKHQLTNSLTHSVSLCFDRPNFLPRLINQKVFGL